MLDQSVSVTYLPSLTSFLSEPSTQVAPSLTPQYDVTDRLIAIAAAALAILNDFDPHQVRVRTHMPSSGLRNNAGFFLWKHAIYLHRTVLGAPSSQPPFHVRYIPATIRCLHDTYPCILGPTCSRPIWTTYLAAFPIRGSFPGDVTPFTRLERRSNTLVTTAIRYHVGGVSKDPCVGHRVGGRTGSVCYAGLFGDTREQARG